MPATQFTEQRLDFQTQRALPAPPPPSRTCSFLWVTSLFLSSSSLHLPLSVSPPRCPSPSFLLPFLLLFSSPCLLGTDGRRSRSSSSSVPSELDDEPPCMEEIEYSADSSSDQEGSFSELDRQIQEWAFHKDEGQEDEEGPGQGTKATP